MTDIFSPYERGLEKLLTRLGKDHPRYNEALTLQSRLLENIAQTRRYGNTEIRRAERAQIVEALNRLALEALGVSFNELRGLPSNIQDLPSSQEIIIPDDLLPPKPVVFIGRADEISEFRQALNSLIQSPSPSPTIPSRRVILIRGEGGWGKTTLLRGQYVEACREHSDQIFWLYIDWERDIKSHQGTPVMMDWLAGRLEAKYQRELSHFRCAQRYVLENGPTVVQKVESLQDHFMGQSQEEFERFLSRHLTSDEYEIYYRPQRRLSETLVMDLLELAKERPIVLLFDTWEVVHDFADEWLRRGLLQHCLAPEIGERFLFTVAGRLSKKAEVALVDAVRRYTHERGIYTRELSAFTPYDIVKYFQEHPRFNRLISEETANRIHETTLGIPLAVEAIAVILQDQGDIDGFLSSIEASSEEEVLDLVVERFLRHLRGPEEHQRKERSCIYTFALARQGGQDTVLQMELLRQVWLRTRLVHNEDEFWSTLRSLQTRYSFLFSGAQMHEDVYEIMRRGLMKRAEDIVALCEKASEFCKLRLDRRFNEIQEQTGSEQLADVEKYKDPQWQEWLINWIHYRMWLQRYDEAISDVIWHYIPARQHGTENFHFRLLSAITDDPLLFGSLPGSRRILLGRLKDIKQWFGLEQMEEETERLLDSLKGLSRFEGYLQAAVSAAEKGNLRGAEEYLETADQIHHNSGEENVQNQYRLAETYYRVGRQMSQSKRTHVRLRSWQFLTKARELGLQNPRMRCALAEALINRGWFLEAKVELEKAKQLMLSEGEPSVEPWVDKLLRTIRDLESSQRYSPKKQAKVAVSRANSLSANGAFREAENLYRLAIQIFPQYLPATIKLAHLLRQLGCIEKGLELLKELPTNESADAWTRASVYNAYGALFYSLGEWDRAIRAYREAIELSSDYINPYYGLGRVHLRLEKVSEALDAFEKAWRCKQRKVQTNASLFWVWNGIGIAHILSGNMNGAEAAFLFAEALCQRLKHKSRQYQTWGHLGLALLGQSRYEEAQEAFQNLASFDQISRAQGFIRELSTDVEVVGTRTQIEGWQKVYALLANLPEWQGWDLNP